MVAGAVNGEKWDFVSNKGDQSIIAVAGGHKGWASFDGSMAASDLVDVVNNGYGSDDYSASVASAGNMSSVAGALLANDIVSGNHWVIVVNPDSTPVSQGTDLTVVGVTKIKIAGIQKNNGSQDGDVYNDNDLQVIGEWSDISVTSYIDITDETWEPPVNAIVPLHTIEVKAE